MTSVPKEYEVYALWTVGNWDRIVDPMSPDSKKAKFMEEDQKALAKIFPSVKLTVEYYQELRKA